MALIGSVNNWGTIQGQINSANGYLTGVISDAALMGGQVVGMRGLPGDKGDTGDTGNGIQSVTKTSTLGLVDTYTILYTNGTTSTFTVTNGQDGADGRDGVDGHSPTITTSRAGKTVTILSDGESIGTVQDGADGSDGTDGADGFSPIANVSKVGDTATITITDENGTTTALVVDGTDGTNGQDGHTPVITASKVGKVTTVYVDGVAVATINDGQDGTGAVTDVQVNGTSVLSAGVADISISAVGLSNDYDDLDNLPTIPTDVSDLNNDAGYITSSDIPVNDVEVNGSSVVNASGVAEVTVPTKTSDLNNDSLFARGHIGNFHGTCSTAAGTAAKVVTCADFKATDLVAGAIIVVSFDNTNSGAVADLTLNVNSTGAYHIKRNNAGTIGNLDSAGYIKGGSSYMFYFDGSYWVITAYDTNTNTIGYTIRTNGLQLKTKTACYRYRLMFTSPDGQYFVPANSSTSTSSTASKTVTTEKIDPWGRIVYYGTTTAVAANSYPTTSYLYQQYNGVALGYSFNRTGSALTMTNHYPVYVKAAPQSDGSAIIDGTTPFVQTLPSTEDGKIYIFLGIATAETTIEFTLEHPVYEYKGGMIRPYTNPDLSGKADVGHTHTTSAITDFPTIPTNTSDLNNDSGFITGVTSTSTPTSSTIAEFDLSSHINSADMSAQDVDDFVDGLSFSYTPPTLDQFVVETHSKSGITVNNYSQGTLNITKAGYYPLGIVGYLSTSSYIVHATCYLSAQTVGSATINYYVSNTSSSERTSEITWRVLWLKAS